MSGIINVSEEMNLLTEKALDDLGVENQYHREVGKRIAQTYFYQQASGRNLLWKITEAGSQIEVSWDAVEWEMRSVTKEFSGPLSGLFKRDENALPKASKLVRHVVSVGYQPNCGLFFLRSNQFMRNTWEAPSVKWKHLWPEYPDMSIWEEYLERLFPNPVERDYVEKWWAVSVIYPERKLRTAIVLRGEQGCGKDFTCEQVLAPLMGDANVKISTIGQVTATHADEVFNSSLLVINEAYAGNKKRVADTLKGIVTQENAYINAKQLRPYRMPVCYNVMLMSNDANPIYLEQGDRRWYYPEYITHSVSMEESAKWLQNTFLQWVKYEGGLAAIHHRFHQIAESVPEGFFNVAGMTESKQAVTYIDLKADYKEQLREQLNRERVAKISLADAVEMANKFLPQAGVVDVLKELGFVSKKAKGGSRSWVRDSKPATKKNIVVTTFPHSLDRAVEAR